MPVMTTDARVLQAAQAGPIRVEIHFVRGKLVASTDREISRAEVSVAGSNEVKVSDTAQGMEIIVGKGRTAGRSTYSFGQNTVTAGSVGTVVQLGDLDGSLDLSGDGIVISGKVGPSRADVDEATGEVDITVRAPEGSQVVAVTKYGETTGEGVRIQTRRPE
jgi:hypothetical protein